MSKLQTLIHQANLSSKKQPHRSFLQACFMASTYFLKEMQVMSNGDTGTVVWIIYSDFFREKNFNKDFLRFLKHHGG